MTRVCCLPTCRWIGFEQPEADSQAWAECWQGESPQCSAGMQLCPEHSTGGVQPVLIQLLLCSDSTVP